jgi:N-acyl-D-aspartate/D-glutamate deacylase
MAIYMGLVVTKQWKAGTAISVDDHVKMIVPGDISLVTHEDIEIELPQSYGSMLQ